MDLGTILGGIQQVADIYNQVKYSGPQIMPMPVSNTGGYPGLTFADDPNVGAFDEMDNAMMATRGGTKGMVFDPAANCGSGKWIKKRRRKRKRLATKADISELAQLKGTLGMGKAMETWIATHS